MDKEEIPQHVIEALAEVRESGATNMFDFEAVCFYVEMGWDFEAHKWLTENRWLYMDALNAMGKTVKRQEA